MIITNEHDFAVWRDKLRTKLIQIMEDEYKELKLVIGYEPDESAVTNPMHVLYLFDDEVANAGLRDLIGDVFWKIDRDLAREEAA